eukprot:TRINITY_DN3986_c0_g1_i1.p1 TRINITY_DN3986_c0_g1~~TRINITY_DN3986_c0_g1_i1.p1  ORF type:complete len:411 (+),score=193.51 TRINITY_DN3986_c0_g1_i1:60-1235(+)
MLRTTSFVSKVSQTLVPARSLSTEVSQYLSAVGISSFSGAASENNTTLGAGKALDQLLYQGNLTSSKGKWSSHYKLFLNLGAINLRSERSRETYIITANVLEKNADVAQELIQDITHSGGYTGRQFQIYKDAEHQEPTLAEKVDDAIHEIAFRNQSLARELYPSTSIQSSVTVDGINAFISNINKSAAVKSQYGKGGESRISGDRDTTIVAVAFEGAKSGDIKEALAARIFSVAVGGVKRIEKLSRAYPGDGLTSKIAQKFSGKSWVQEASSWTREYSSSGLVGTTVTIDADATESADIVSEIVEIYNGAKNLSAEEFNAAKKSFASDFLDYYFTVNGRFLVNQHFKTDKAAVVSALESITHQDVLAVVKKIAASKPSVVVAGNLLTVRSL